MLSILSAFRDSKKENINREPVWFFTKDISVLFFVSRQSVDSWARKKNILPEKFEVAGRQYKKFEAGIIHFFVESELSLIEKKKNHLTLLKKKMDEILIEPDPRIANIKKQNLIAEFQNLKTGGRKNK